MTTIDTTIQNTPEKPYWNTVLRFGLICGGAGIVLQLLLYLIDFNMMTLTGWGSMILFSLIMNGTIAGIGTGHQRDKVDGGFISFGRAFTVAALIILVASVISSIWSVLFTQVLVPDYVESLKENFVEAWSDVMTEEQMEQSLKGFDEQQGIGKTLTAGIGFGVLFSVILGLIVAGFQRREPDYPLGR
jgi:Protein of unknown function (DUF4199)